MGIVKGYNCNMHSQSCMVYLCSEERNYSDFKLGQRAGENVKIIPAAGRVIKRSKSYHAVFYSGHSENQL